MERKNNINFTKENPVRKVNEKLYPIEKEDREIMRLENTYDILSIALKVEMAITLVVVTFAFIVNGFPEINEYQERDYETSISSEVEYDTEI